MRLHICGHAVQPTLQAANSFVAAHRRLLPAGQSRRQLRQGSGMLHSPCRHIILRLPRQLLVAEPSATAGGRPWRGVPQCSAKRLGLRRACSDIVIW